MSRWMPIDPWRAITGQGQSKALTSGGDIALTSAIPANCFAVQLSVTGANCCVTISAAGTAATANGDILVKSTDPPAVYRCNPGDLIHAWGLAASATLYAVPVTH